MHPGVLTHLVESDARLGVGAEELKDEVFEGFAESASVSLMEILLRLVIQ